MQGDMPIIGDSDSNRITAVLGLSTLDYKYGMWVDAGRKGDEMGKGGVDC